MVCSKFDTGTETDSLAAVAEGVRAVLRREPDGALSLKLEEKFPEVTEITQGQSTEDAVERIQQAEIERVTRTLSEIRDQLAARVSQTGDTIPGVMRQARTEETRDWHVNARQVFIAGFTTTTKERLTKPDGASESSLIEGFFGVLIADRIQGIQDIYRQVLEDISPGRTAVICSGLSLGMPANVRNVRRSRV